MTNEIMRIDELDSFIEQLDQPQLDMIQKKIGRAHV